MKVFFNFVLKCIVGVLVLAVCLVCGWVAGLMTVGAIVCANAEEKGKDVDEALDELKNLMV